MQKLYARHGYHKCERALRYTTIRLSGRPETAPIAEEFRGIRTDLAGKHEAFAEALERRVAGTAEIDYQDAQVDAIVQDVSRKLLVEVRGDRTDPRYLAAFPVAPSKGMRPTGGASQERYVRTVADALEQDPGLSAEAPALRERLTALQAAEAAREDLYVPEARARAELSAALDAARRAYNMLHPRLTLLFPCDPALVESFFLDLHGGRPAAEDVEEDEI